MALAAVFVSGLTAVLAYLATTNAQQDAASASLRQGDRAELRRVLDEANSSFTQAQDAAQLAVDRWRQHGRALRVDQAQEFRFRTNQVRFKKDQLAIRLGQDSPAYKAYFDGWAQLYTVYNLVQQRPSIPRERKLNVAANRVVNDQMKFVAKAHTLATSVVK